MSDQYRVNRTSMNAGGEVEGDGFERWLIDQLQRGEPYLDDNGFTEKVMEALPPAPAGHPFSRRIVVAGIVVVMGVLSLAIVACYFPLLGLMIDTAVFLSLLTLPTLLVAGLLFAAVFSTFWALAGVWALGPDML